MSAAVQRKRLKKLVDELPESQLELAEAILSLLIMRARGESFSEYLKNRPSIAVRMKQAKREVRVGRGVNWRSVRRDV